MLYDTQLGCNSPKNHRPHRLKNSSSSLSIANHAIYIYIYIYICTLARPIDPAARSRNFFSHPSSLSLSLSLLPTHPHTHTHAHTQRHPYIMKILERAGARASSRRAPLSSRVSRLLPFARTLPLPRRYIYDSPSACAGFAAPGGATTTAAAAATQRPNQYRQTS